MYKTKKYALMTTVLISASLLYFGLNAETGGNIEYPDFETYGQTVYLPTYIPEGYTVQDVNITGKMIVSMFTCKSDYILFTQVNFYNIASDLDNSNYETQRAKLGNTEGYFSNDGDRTIFTYYKDDYLFSVSGTLDKSELSKIVNSVELYAQ